MILLFDFPSLYDMFHSVTNILSSLKDIDGKLRTLDGAAPCLPLQYAVGNSAVVCRVRYQDQDFAMKCYTSQLKNLELIYGEKAYREELSIYGGSDDIAWADVVMLPWIEGETLHHRLRSANRAELKRLSQAFDTLALEMLLSPKAHGDVKGENIIVDRYGALHLIDLDRAFLPELSGKLSPGLGSSGFQHPLRLAEHFDRDIDDYSLALISATLRTLAAEEEIKIENPDGTLFDPAEILSGRSATWRRALECAARRGDGVTYRLLLALNGKSYKIAGLRSLLTPIAGHNDPATLCFSSGGYIDSSGRQIIHEIFDNGMHFEDSLAAVSLAGHWHYINSQGSAVKYIGKCEAIRPPSHGVGYSMLGGIWRQHRY
ncbi:MAG: WG repeat-containing protein [Rikenellaceae bacterium]